MLRVGRDEREGMIGKLYSAPDEIGEGSSEVQN